MRLAPASHVRAHDGQARADCGDQERAERPDRLLDRERADVGDHWKIWNDQAREFGHEVDRSTWRLVGPMHVAPTRKQALEEVEYGIHDWIDYFRNVVALPLAPEEPDPRKWPQAIVESGTAVIGTPDDAAAQLERLKKQSAAKGTTNPSVAWCATGFVPSVLTP